MPRLSLYRPTRPRMRPPRRADRTASDAALRPAGPRPTPGALTGGRALPCLLHLPDQPASDRRGPLSGRLGRFVRDERGTVSLEFVLVAPLLMALLFGIVSLGYYMGVSHSVRQLASGAARASVPGLDQAERRSLAEAYLAQAGTNYPLLTPASVAPRIAFETGPSAISVAVAYTVDGSLLDVANSLLKLNLSSIDASAYLAY